MINKVAKFEIVCPVDVEWNVLGEVLRDVEYESWRIHNLAVTMAWDFSQVQFGYLSRFGEKLAFDDLGTGKKQQADIYAEARRMFPNTSSNIATESVRAGMSRFKALYKDIIVGKSVLPTFRKNVTIPLRAKDIRLASTNGKYYVTMTLLSRDSGKDTAYTVIVRAKGSAGSVFNKLLSGEYKLADSSLKRNGKKWFVNLTYKFEPTVAPTERTAVVGVDLGVINAAVAAVNSGHDRLYIEGGEITAFNNRTDARRRSLQRQYKVAEGRKGHGRKSALKPTEVLAEKAANFRNMTNHKYAKAIVEFAVKAGAYRIQMEDLSGITENRDKFLKRWPYYDLQTKIANKAKEVGIEVVKVKPRYTSQRCSCCGYIADGNRPDQSTFKCVSCGYKTNADYNAARNIAEPRIEALIDEELRRQKMAMKHAN